MNRLVSIGLYRHFKGEYFYVSGLSRSAEDEKTVMVNYFNVCHPEYGNFVRPLDDFIATHDQDGKAIVDKFMNITGQTARFERVKDLNFQLGSISTEQLISELRRRTDSPIHELDIEGLRSNIFCIDYIVGDKHFATEDYPCGVTTVASFEDLEKAQKYYETHKHRKATGIFKRTFIEVI